MLAKIQRKDGGWVFGKIMDGYFVTPSGARYLIDNDGYITYQGYRTRVLNATA
jgi:hypothetical protein